MIYHTDPRKDWSIKHYEESTFEFIQRSAWPITNFVRQFVNCNMAPFENDKEFVSKLSSGDDRQHEAAMFELLLFTLLSNNKMHIKRVPRKSRSKTPDFSITLQSRQELFVECTLAASAMDPKGETKKMESVMRYIEGLKNYPYFISADFRKVSDDTLSKKRLVRFIDSLMLDNASSKSGDLAGVYPYSDNGWEVNIHLIKKNNRGVSRSRGFTTQPVRLIDNFTPLYNALNDKKPRKYKIAGTSYMICLGIDDLTANEEEFFTALYGPNFMDRINLSYPGEGFFIRDGKPANTSVSAVMFCKNLKAFSLATSKFFLWHHPFASHPIDKDLFPVDEIYYILEGNFLNAKVIEKNFDLFSCLGIDKKEYLEFMQYKNRKKPD